MGLLFVYCMTYGGSIVALYRPFYGLLIYICFGLIRPEALWFYSVPPGNYSRTIGIALLVGWMFAGFGSWQFGRSKVVIASYLGLFAWTVVSAMFASVPEIAWDYVDFQTKLFLPYVVGMTLIRTPDQARQVAWVIVASLGYVAFEANMNYLNQGYHFIIRVRNDGFCGFDSNLLAASMVAGAGLAMLVALEEARRWVQLVAGLAAATMAHVVMLAFSRGGLIGLAVAGGAAFLVVPRRPFHYLALAGGLAMGLVMVGPELRERFGTSFQEERDASAQSRVDLSRDLYDLMMRNPILGAGPDHWAVYAHTYGWPPFKAAHNMWLKIGSELGAVGLLLLISFHGSCVVRLFGLIRRQSQMVDPQVQSLARLAIVAMLAFFASATFINGDRLEVVIYVNLIGAATLKLASEGRGEASLSPGEVAEIPLLVGGCQSEQAGS